MESAALKKEAIHGTFAGGLPTKKTRDEFIPGFSDLK